MADTHLTQSEKNQKLEILNSVICSNASKMNPEKIPNEFFCSLTKEIFNDPVVNQYGNSYERKVYESYVAVNKKDPISNKPIINYDVYTNFNLIEAIDEFLLK